MKNKKIVIIVLFFTLLFLVAGVAIAERVRCDECKGRGTLDCTSCNGSGREPVPHVRPGTPGSTRPCTAPGCIRGQVECWKCEGAKFVEKADPPNPNIIIIR